MSTVRTQMRVEKEVMEDAKALAKWNGLSFNGLVHSLLRRATLMPSEFGLLAPPDPPSDSPSTEDSTE